MHHALFSLTQNKISSTEAASCCLYHCLSMLPLNCMQSNDQMQLEKVIEEIVTGYF